MVLEIVLRKTHFFRARTTFSKPDKVLGWRFIPNSTYWCFKENDHPITGKINSHGWRDKEWSSRKPINTYRIAVLGDSFVEAFQVESEFTFLQLTENQLNKDQTYKVELLNFGRSGFTQTEELIVLKNYTPHFSPDIVILFFYAANDISDVGKETAHNLLHPFYRFDRDGELILDLSLIKTNPSKIKRFLYKLDRYSALISLIYQRYDLLRQQIFKKEKIKLEINSLNNYLTLCTTKKDKTYLQNYNLNKMLIKTMAKYCNKKGIQFMLININDTTYIPEIEEKYKFIDATFNANYFDDDLYRYAKLLNIEYLGLQKLFRRTYIETGVELNWGHWNYEGHKTVANALSNKLIQIIKNQHTQ